MIYCSICKTLGGNLVKINKHIKKDGSITQYCHCRPCNNKRTKRYYKKNSESVAATIRKSEARNPLRRKAYSLVNEARKSGRIVKPTNCERCNATGRIEGHHEDYLKPLEVQWLCTGCHADADKRLREMGMLS